MTVVMDEGHRMVRVLILQSRPGLGGVAGRWLPLDWNSSCVFSTAFVINNVAISPIPPVTSEAGENSMIQEDPFKKLC